MSTATQTTAQDAVIALPKGGGAVGGLGEKFAPDLFTGTGNFSVPIAVPAGRPGLTPRLALGYSTGNGNGPYGMGWKLGLPGISRRTSHGVPRYDDGADVFVLSGAEDLVPVSGHYPGRVRYQPRTEGQFARIEHVSDATGDFWLVRSTDGLLTTYGTPRPEGAEQAWRDPAAVTDPADPGRIFDWRITETRDTFGSVIRYDYRPDRGAEPGHRWDQPLPSRICYADHGDPADPAFLVVVDFEYEPRPDPFSGHRAGFEIRTSLRCRTIRVATHAADGVTRPAREYAFGYQPAAFNGVSLLSRVDVTGVDGESRESLPPLTFDYSAFDPAGRTFAAVTGPGLPTTLDKPGLALVDLRGVGLPDLVELGAAPRFWRNAGAGRFELPRGFTEAPPYALGDRGVQLLDADGDGRPDLLVTTDGRGGRAAGYFPMAFRGGWSRRNFQAYRQSPSVDLADPRVRLIDLDGDGLTDILRSGTRLECWFNDPDPRQAWQRTATGGSSAPPVDLADPRIRLADMTGDGLQDIVLLRDGNVAYWPNLGHGRWGAPVTMRHAPRLPGGFEPRRVLLGDLDGDGAADLVYVGPGQVLVWGNRSGNAFTEEPVVVTGTPGGPDTDGLRLVDLYGAGTAGLLFSRAADTSGRHLRFLDLTGGVKPYLLTGMDNHLGAATRVRYASSTSEYLRDQARPSTRWRTTLPFPVHVVTHVEVADTFSGGRLTTEYRYHHGYYDGAEREFRGFASVEHFDTEAFTGTTAPQHSPPTLTRAWFHPGPVAADEAGDWTELDLRHEYADTPMLTRPASQTALLAGLPRGTRRDALRALRGQVLRTELYALDGTLREQSPYTVTEALAGVRPEAAGVFFPFPLGSRTTQYDRGDEPLTRFTFPAGYDAYGFPTGEISVAVPRGRDPLAAADAPGVPYLATWSTTERARRVDAGHYLVDRVARTTTREIVNDGRHSVVDLRDAVLAGAPAGSGVSLRIAGHSRTYYDGDAFTGLPLGDLGEHGLPVRVESLACTEEFLDGLHRPVYLTPGAGWTADYPREFRDLLPPLAGYRHYPDGEVPGSPGGYYVISARHRYDAQVPGRVARGLPVASLDALGAPSRIDYDQHDLLPVRTVDAAGLETAAGYDYRILQPRDVTDPNGTTTSATYSPLGLVTATFVRGADGTGDGVTPGARTTYDLLAFADRGQPASVRTTRRVHHDTDTGVPAARRDDVLVTVEFSDGFGRILQTRVQAEDTLFGDPEFGGAVLPLDQFTPAADPAGRVRAPGDPDNVLVSGWQVYDNKGRVVAKYEPFFGTGFDYAAPLDAQRGQQSVMYYDPRGQLVRTVSPDGSEQRVVLGIPADLNNPDVFTPTPWESYAYDANDNAGRTHPGDAQPYAGHWNTPSVVEIDALGRTVRTRTSSGATGADVLTVRSEYDIRGTLIAVVDTLGRTAVRYTVDLADRRWRTDSADAGRRDFVPDALGNPVEIRDAKGALTLNAMDLLHRPIRSWSRDDAAGPVTLRQRIEYGDGGVPGQPSAERAAARARYLLGRPVRHYDEAGLLSTDVADCKGNVLQVTRTVIADAPLLAGYEQARTDGWRVPAFRLDWTPGPGQSQAQRDAQLLEPGGYVSSTAYDALSRVTRHTMPADVEGRRRVLTPAYNRAGALEQVRLDDTVFVQRIGYDAKGQRTLIAYGNGVLTRYAYDPRTFRLARLRSEHYALTGDAVYRAQGPVLQDYGYDYDLVGNVRTLRDRTPGCGIPGNPDALLAADPRLRALLGSGDALDRQFSYDPLYRLRSATGREHQQALGGDPWLDLPRGTDITRAQRYTETYRYDHAGNLTQLAHAGPGGFTRDFTVEEGTNRLRRLTVGSTPYDYGYDAAGNLTAEAGTRRFGWDHADRLGSFATQTPGAEPSIHAQYLYDAGGRRVKKLVRRQGGGVDVTHYPVGGFEHHRWSGSRAGANNTLHVMDDERRIAMVRAGAAHPEDHGPAVTFHLADHLGSGTVVLDATGDATNREEYTPYGETSFGSFTRKRFRFAGAERDEESGLSYQSARYYAPALGRWISCDPAGLVREPNLYAYCGQEPLGRRDTSGTDWEFCNPFDRGCGVSSSVEVLDDEIKVDDAVAGFGDTVSFGLTAKIRGAAGVDSSVDYSSTQYKGGQVAGAVHSAALGGAGLAKSVIAIGVPATLRATATVVVATEGAARLADKADPSGTTSSFIRCVVAYGAALAALRNTPAAGRPAVRTTGSGGAPPGSPPPGPRLLGEPPAPAPAAAAPPRPTPSQTPRFQIGEGVRRAVAHRELGIADAEAIHASTRQPLGRIPLEQMLSPKPSVAADGRYLNIVRGVAGANPPGANPPPPIEVTPIPAGAPTTNLTPVPQVRLTRARP